MSRRVGLENLLAANGDIPVLVSKVAAHSCDIHVELVELEASHIVGVSPRYIKNELSPAEIEEWANAIESREDIAIMGKMGDSLLQAIHELANSALGYSLAPAATENIIKKSLC